MSRKSTKDKGYKYLKKIFSLINTKECKLNQYDNLSLIKLLTILNNKNNDELVRT